MILREIRRGSFFFVGFKVKRQVAAYLVNLDRSVFKQIVAARGLSTTMKKLVSSAKRRVFEPIALKISFIYNNNYD